MIILDRYEGEFAVIEDNGVIKSISKNELEGDIPEGSVLVIKNGKYFLDNKQTNARREKLIGLQDSLFE